MPSDPDEKLAAIFADLSYYRKSIASMGVGGQPPTIYASKYVEDLDYLLQLGGLMPKTTPAVTQPSQLEMALADDQAGRVERKRKP